MQERKHQSVIWHLPCNTVPWKVLKVHMIYVFSTLPNFVKTVRLHWFPSLMYLTMFFTVNGSWRIHLIFRLLCLQRRFWSQYHSCRGWYQYRPCRSQHRDLRVYGRTRLSHHVLYQGMGNRRDPRPIPRHDHQRGTGWNGKHCGDVIMGAIASQITSLTIVYSAVYSDADQRKHQSSASLASVWGIHRDRWIPRTNGQ